MDLLEKSSILLTPTAYNNGEALCIKPDNGSGDFQFSRNSAATRVNAQGLVENVQILSSNLVQNGDFSEEGSEEVSNGSFSQEGSELITNGSFDTDSNWNKQTSNWTISNGYAVCDGLQTTNSSLFQDLAVVNGNSYRIDFTITDSANDLNLILGATTIGQYGDGTHTVYVEKDSGGARIFFQATASNAFQGSIDNVSVREVGQDWTLGTGWSIGEDKAERISTGTYTPITQGGILTAGKSYKVTYTVNDGSVGGVRVQLGGTYAGDYNGVGTHTIYGVAGTSDFNNFKLVGEPSFNGSITNISVKEVGQNWSLGTGWSIGDNIIYFNNPTGTELYQSLSTTASKYKIKFDLDLTSGNCQTSFASPGSSTIESFTTSGTKEVIIETTSNYSKFRFVGLGNSDFSITNISIIEISSDTNLPRINYEGFSYQDALGSELITNGTFDTDTGWNKGAGWSISGGTANCNGTTTNLVSNIPITPSVGKQGKLKFEITNYVSGQIALSLNGTGGSETGVFTPVNGFYEFDLFGVMQPTSTFITIYSTAFIGSIDNVSVKEYLGQEVVPDSGCGSWLFEPQSTNLITQSETFNGWILGSNSTLTYESDVVAPDGSLGVYRLANPATSNTFIQSPSFSNSNPLTVSLYVKSTGSGNDNFNFYTGASNVSDLKTATSNWQRFDYTADGSSMYIINSGDAYASDIYIWGAQAEALSYATSYIPTSGSSVTRNQDVCINGGSLASINSTEGVLYAEIAALADDLTFRSISLSDGTTSNRCVLRYGGTTNKVNVLISSGGLIIFDNNFTLTEITDFNKIAVKYKQDDFAFWVNGVEVATDTNGNTPIGLNELSYDAGDGGLKYFGKTKALAVWKEALSDSELQSLTTI